MSIATAFVLCLSPIVVDGDTFRCKGATVKYRMAGIDAPDHTCKNRKIGNCFLTGPKGDWTVSRDALKRMFRRGKVRVLVLGQDPFKRTVVAVCARDGNLNARMITKGYAIHKPTWTGKGVKVKC
jgi:endonuclease YncB( thermonuclease family)